MSCLNQETEGTSCEKSVQIILPQNQLDQNQNSNENNERKPLFKSYIGICLSLCSSLLFSSAMLIVKLLNEKYHSFSLSHWRFQGVIYPSIAILLYYNCVKKAEIFSVIWPLSCSKPQSQDNWKTLIALIIRGFVGTASVLFSFYAVSYISIADQSVITFSTPVFVTLVAHLVLGEKCKIVPILVAFSTICGVFLITRPPFLTGKSDFDTDTLIGTLYALGAMTMSGSVFIVLRYLRKVHYSIVISYFGLSGAIISIIFSVSILGVIEIPQTTHDWVLGLGLGLSTFIGQLMLTAALKFEEANIISLMRTCDVIFSFFLQYIFLGVQPDEYSLIGSAIVCSGVILIGFRKWVESLDKLSKTKKMFSCLLY